MSPSKDFISEYEYVVPPELVAQRPASPRDSARLLVYDRATHEVNMDTFAHLAKYLSPKSVIVLNQTKVIPARLWCTKPTGGKVQVFYIRHDRHYIYALCDRAISEKIVLGLGKHELTVVKKTGSVWRLKPSFPLRSVMSVLAKHGSTPIPPYIKHSPLSEKKLRSEYQAIFARTAGSVAAPTASLHFTKGLLAKLKRAGHSIHFVTLHVGLGTFASVTDAQLKSGKLHEEYYEISTATARALAAAKKSGRPIVAVGTTVVRTLESWTASGRCGGTTDLFIRPGYHWKFVDALITNFHVPRSSLMMLVASLISREQLLALYRLAISQRFRLFSFGDGMLIR